MHLYITGLHVERPLLAPLARSPAARERLDVGYPGGCPAARSRARAMSARPTAYQAIARAASLPQALAPTHGRGRLRARSGRAPGSDAVESC